MMYTKAKADHYIQNSLDKVNPLHRHSFHFMPQVGWMNDPNGTVYFDGYFHIFYQFYPYDACWGPMHWGHARSKDLLHWEHLPVALAPDLPHEEGCFSGGAVVFNKELLLMYTSHLPSPIQIQEQSLARSKDGMTFTKNTTPVITRQDLPHDASKTDFRDPNPVTIDGQHFVLVGSSTLDKRGQILVYKTEDFKTFTYLNAIQHPYFGEIAECPDLFELDGHHVLLFSATQLKAEGHRFLNVNSSLYAIGHFDLHTGSFTFNHIDELDAGHHYYAPQTMVKDHQRISMAWMEMWGKPYYLHQASHGWTGALTLPRQLTIKNHRLYQVPLTLDLLKTRTHRFTTSSPLTLGKRWILKTTLKTTSLTTIRVGDVSSSFTLSINKTSISLDTSTIKLFPLPARHLPHACDTLEITLIMDQSSLELFVTQLDKTITTRVYLDSPLITFTLNTPQSLTVNVDEILG